MLEEEIETSYKLLDMYIEDIIQERYWREILNKKIEIRYDWKNFYF